MNNDDPKVYERPEEYKIGFVHGFYDSMSNEDGRYHELRRAWAIQGSTRPQPEAARLYDDGYYDGFRRRVEGQAALEGVRIRELKIEASAAGTLAGIHEMRGPVSELDNTNVACGVR